MAKGISIHIGINRVDASQYGGWSGDLVACEYDAKDMEKICKANGFETRSFMTAKATSKAVTAALKDAAGKLSKGDSLVLTYSGHGGQVPDANNDEADRKDETWVLYDRQLVDDELYSLWAAFQPGVKIAVFSDSCHSGSVTRNVLRSVKPEVLTGVIDTEPDEHCMRAMPEDVVPKAYEANKDVYDDVQKSLPSGDKVRVGASVLLVSGCQDNQTSADGKRNGLFTQTLLKVWDDGKFRGGYRTLAKKILSQMPPWQSPNYYLVGAVDRAFERQRPFTA